MKTLWFLLVQKIIVPICGLSHYYYFCYLFHNEILSFSFNVLQGETFVLNVYPEHPPLLFMLTHPLLSCNYFLFLIMILSSISPNVYFQDSFLTGEWMTRRCGGFFSREQVEKKLVEIYFIVNAHGRISYLKSSWYVSKVLLQAVSLVTINTQELFTNKSNGVSRF